MQKNQFQPTGNVISQKANTTPEANGFCSANDLIFKLHSKKLRNDEVMLQMSYKQ